MQMFYVDALKPVHSWVKRPKGQGHNTFVGLQTERNIAAGGVRKPRCISAWVVALLWVPALSS